MTLHLHRDAAVRQPRRTRPAQPVTTQQVPAVALDTALSLAGGDPARLKILSATEVVVLNHTRRTS